MAEDPTELYPETRELLTLIFSQQALREDGDGPPTFQHYIPAEAEHLLEVLLQSIGIMSVMLLDVADLAGVDLAESWRGTIADLLLDEDEPGC